MTAAGQKRQHCGCVEIQFLCSLASVQRVWLQVVCNLGQKKDTVACETDPLFIIGTKSRKESSLSLVPLLDLYPEDR